MVITSRNNPKIKRIRKLLTRKERDQSGLFLIEGIRLVTEAVQTGATIETIIVAPELLSSEIAHEMVSGYDYLEVSPHVFESIASKDNPQGIAAVVHQHHTHLDDIVHEGELCWVALDAVQNPGNLGTILRTNDAVGAAGVILLGNCTDPYHPTAMRGSMGAIFSQRIATASYQAFIAWKQRSPYKVVGTISQEAQHYRQLDYSSPLVLLMGSEREGLPASLLAICDYRAHIPMVGRSDSLNLAVATGVMLYEIFAKQR